MTEYYINLRYSHKGTYPPTMKTIL